MADLGGPLALDATATGELLHAAAAAVARHLDEVPGLPVAPAEPVEPGAVRRWLAAYELEAPQPAGVVVADLIAQLQQWTVHTTHPRYFGLFNPTPTAAGIAGELLAAGVNPQLAAWSHAPAAAEAEQHVLRFLARRLGLPESSMAGNVTTGGAEANLTAVLLALTRAFPEYAAAGLRGLGGQPVFYASAESHLAWVKIAHMTGLGRDALRLVPVDRSLRLDVARLEAAIAADRAAGSQPFLVVATVGTTGGGAIDPLDELADVAAGAGCALHVDAAWAGAVALSDRLRPLLAGVERADSVTVDAHKWLSVPMGAGMLLARDAELFGETFRLATGYMPGPVADAADPYATSLQWSRRFAGLKILLSLAVHGRARYAAQIEHDVDLGERLAARLAEHGWERVNATPLPVVCVTHEQAAGLEPDAAWAWHEHAAAQLRAAGAGWVSPVRLAGRPALRACITSFRTTAEDVDRLADAVGRITAGGYDPAT